MINFEFQCKTKILFGKGTELLVGKQVSFYSKNILFVYGGGSIKKSGLYDQIMHSLNEYGIAVTELSGVVANPRVSLCRKGVSLCKEKKIDFILAVGGGSVIDTAKAIGIGAYYDGDVWDFYTGKAQFNGMLPIGTILTFPAAGSEASDSNVITNEETKEKLAFGHPDMRPEWSICNPELSYTLPNYQTACGCMDMMAHTFERYFTNEEHVELTDRLCEACLITIMDQLPKVLLDNKNYDARAELMWVGTVAHNDITGTGRIQCWGNHMLEHEISAIYDITHGAGLAITYPAWMKVVANKNPKKLLQFCVRVMGVSTVDKSEDDIIKEGISKFESFLKANGLPIRLSDEKIGQECFEEIANRCTANGTTTLGNYIQMDKETIIEILNLAK